MGAMLHLSGPEWEPSKNQGSFAIQTRVMESTSIARVELLTVLWALSDVGPLPGVNLFTDCQMIENLSGRRAKLEAANYKSKRTGLSLANADLYQKFFEVYDEVHPVIHWIKGHTATSRQNEFHRVFSFVDRAARKALREHIL